MAMVEHTGPQPNTPIRNRLRFEWALVTTLCALIALAIAHFAPNNRIDLALYDAGQIFRNTPVSDKILLVRIDDDSLTALGQWPWPRSTHAKIIDRLYTDGAMSVGMDVLFPESTADDPIFAETIRKKTLRGKDALRKPMPVVLAMSYIVPGPDGQDYAAMPPAPLLANAATATGHVMQSRDPDGILRRVAVQFGVQTDATKGTALHLAETLFQLNSGGKPSALYQSSSAQNRDVLIPFTSDAMQFPSVSYAALLSGQVPRDFIKGRIVIIGAAAPGLGDIHPMPNTHSPTGQGTGYGMDIIAHTLNAMLVGASIRTLQGSWLALWTVLPIVVLMGVVARLRPALSLPAGAAMALIVLAGSTAALSFGLWVAPSGALAGTLLAYPMWSWRRLHTIDDYVGRELANFSPSHRIDIPTTADRLLPDPAAVRVDRLRQAIIEVEALRRFVTDALDQLPDPLLVTDTTGLVRLANRAAQAIFDATFLTRPLHELVPDAAVQDEYTLPDGSRVFDIRRAPLLDAKGSMRGNIWYLADITPERRAQEDRENVLRFLSHDMRSPQASILALMDMEDASKIDATLASTIRNHARQTINLADNFIQLARLQASGIAREPVDIANLLHEIADDFYALAKAHGTRLSIVTDGPDGPDDANPNEANPDNANPDNAGYDNAEPDNVGHWVLGDDHALRRAIGNLVGNALKYGGENGVITLGVTATAETEIAISISDTGPGIAPDQREAVFAMFDQGATGTAMSGAGLGLSYVKQVVTAHGGQIKITDVMPHGACFTMIFAALVDNTP